MNSESNPMDHRSETALMGVHVDLCRVMRATSQSPQPFLVIAGLRTPQRERELYCQGRSHTLRSRHLAEPGARACAVDVAPLINGQVSFAPGREAEVYGQVIAQVREAAKWLGVPLEWGGDWNWKDWGHIQLPWREYP